MVWQLESDGGNFLSALELPKALTAITWNQVQFQLSTNLTIFSHKADTIFMFSYHQFPMERLKI